MEEQVRCERRLLLIVTLLAVLVAMTSLTRCGSGVGLSTRGTVGAMKF